MIKQKFEGIVEISGDDPNCWGEHLVLRKDNKDVGLIDFLDNVAKYGIGDRWLVEIKIKKMV